MKNKKPSLKNYIPLFAILTFAIVSIITVYICTDQKNKSFTNRVKIGEIEVCQTLCGDDAEITANLAKEKIKQIKNKISYTSESSGITKLNNAAGSDWIAMDDDVFNIITKLIDISKKSSGIFDLTFLPLVELWGFDKKLDMVDIPDNQEIENALKNINYNNVRINDISQEAKLENEFTKVTLQQVENATACQKALEIYKNNKVDYGIISVGKTIGLFETKYDNSAWKISIKNPFNDQEKNIAAAEVSSGFISTFGTAEDKIKIDESLYNKAINAKTGLLADNDTVSVTVFHRDAVIADSLAYLCCVLGEHESENILSGYDAQAVFVRSSKEIYATAGIKSKVSILDPDYTLV